MGKHTIIVKHIKQVQVELTSNRIISELFNCLHYQSFILSQDILSLDARINTFTWTWNKSKENPVGTLERFRQSNTWLVRKKCCRRQALCRQNWRQNSNFEKIQHVDKDCFVKIMYHFEKERIHSKNKI